MKKIIYFNKIEDFDLHVFKSQKYILSEWNSEGIVYLTKTGEVIKDMQNAYEGLEKMVEDYPDIIMADDLKLDSFYFPKELYIYQDRIIGYKTDYFPGNIFEINFWNSSDMNIENLIEARAKFIEDVKILTNEGYNLFELPRNILFNNKKLAAIDTLDYQRVQPSLEDNIASVDYAILLALIDYYGKAYDIENNIDPIDMDFRTAIKKIKELKKTRY